jgi:NAD+ dependent glucose-6-phosphate dehydrogenase
MNDTRRRVLITGAAGRIGTELTKRLKDRYDLRLHFNRNVPDEPLVDDYLIANIAHYDQIAPAMDGIDSIIHLAGQPSWRAEWESVHEANVLGQYNVYESARRAGVRKIIFASTNHVMGMYDRDMAWPVYADLPVRPDSLYGVTKAFGETLGRHYHDRYGMSIINLRIGWFLDKPTDEIGRYMWLSPRDFAQLVWRCIESDIGYGTFYAISANSSRNWDITDSIVKLGYRPQDDADDHLPPDAGNRQFDERGSD